MESCAEIAQSLTHPCSISETSAWMLHIAQSLHAFSLDAYNRSLALVTQNFLLIHELPGTEGPEPFMLVFLLLEDACTDPHPEGPRLEALHFHVPNSLHVCLMPACIICRLFFEPLGTGHSTEQPFSGGTLSAIENFQDEIPDLEIPWQDAQKQSSFKNF